MIVKNHYHTYLHTNGILCLRGYNKNPTSIYHYQDFFVTTLHVSPFGIYSQLHLPCPNLIFDRQLSQYTCAHSLSLLNKNTWVPMWIL